MGSIGGTRPDPGRGSKDPERYAIRWVIASWRDQGMFHGLILRCSLGGHRASQMQGSNRL